MKGNYTLYKKIRSSILLLMLLCVGVFSSMAQKNMTKIKDGTISGSSAVPGLGAILELESTNKGFLMPRLSTQQRDAIAVADRVDGLMVYNTTTGCFNFWTTAQETWLSICGSPPPATITISEAQCQGIVVGGVYKQGEELHNSNALRIPVTVTQAGSYDVMVSTDNGYYFSTQGTFPSAGRYTVVLTGSGTPGRGYEEGANGSTVGIGDKLTLSFNGKEEALCDTRIFVVKAPVNYTFTCSDIEVLGKYMIGKSLDDSNKLKIKVNVTATGYWSIQTNTVNGYSFSGSGKFEKEGLQEIELLGTGASISSGLNAFTITTNAEANQLCSSVSVTVVPVKYALDCSTAPVVAGIFKHDVTLTAENTVTVRVNVEATGSTEIKTNTVEGMYFSSGNIVFDTVGEREVILTGIGKPTRSGTLNFTIVQAQGMEGSCSFDVTVQKQDVVFTMDCSKIAVAGNYAPNTVMGTGNTITLTVNVEYLGEYEITTNTENGISFRGTGTFTTTGEQNITLVATGKTILGGVYRFTLTSNTTRGQTTCSALVQSELNHAIVLSFAKLRTNHAPNANASGNAVEAILRNASNFGANGIVSAKVKPATNPSEDSSGGYSAAFDLLNPNKNKPKLSGVTPFLAYQVSSYTKSSFRDLFGRYSSQNIEKYPYGIVYLGDEFIDDASKNNYGSIADQLLEKVDGNNVFVVLASQTNIDFLKYFFNKIDGSTPTFTLLTNSHLNPISDLDNIVLNGPFGDARGKYAGSHEGTALYVTNYSDQWESLVSHSDKTKGAWMLKHKTKGIIFVGDSGWASGGSAGASDNHSTSYPVKLHMTSGKPLVKLYGASSNPDELKEVYNGILYANVFTLALQHLQQHFKQP